MEQYRNSANEKYIEQIRIYTEERKTALGELPGAYIRTFGCQQNEADSESYSGMACEMGYRLVDSPEEAELILFNTCAVREHAELKALSITGQLKHIKTANPDVIICVCGCMPAQEHRLGDLKNKYPYIDITFGATSLGRFPEYLSEYIKRRKNERETKKRLFFPDTTANIVEGIPVVRKSSYKAFVSIMYGCNNFCTYCVVPYVRGRERSRRKEDILADIRVLAEAGYKEITLLGQNVNSYGKDLYGASYDFADLLTEICKIKGDFWVRFMTSHPKDASHKLIDVIADHCADDMTPRMARHFHLPLQSGSNRILEKMNRRYSAEYYLELVEYMKSRIPDITLTSDIIVGFPGETDEDFADTLNLLEKVRFVNIFSFIYSPRKGTPAAEMIQLPDEMKSQRFDALLKLQNRISLESNRDYIGNTTKVLVEGRSKTNPEFFTGRNEHNRLVHFPSSENIEGCFVNVKVNDGDVYTLKGTLTDK
ncbi:MAG: tRNA (N6-isopentenyl adenosine(37)-C2)-methylthiotransferase MiaB [Clostridia bacterium]|nr:tRNA (N6-isopentenyl adenosine(37)-C2)-methylthiotransferase MiaB [Clostridia bacterium]